MPALDEPSSDEAALRLRVRVRGQVQGVGFRPFVARAAMESALTGWVRNDGAGVLLEVQGPRAMGLPRRLREGAPSGAVIDDVEVDGAPPVSGEAAFSILESADGPLDTLIPPDRAVCGDCLSELFDPADRRYRYPFLSCTACGPRFTLAEGPPFDRRRTGMAGFPPCPDCASEYGDPTDRRFHAQTTACEACGPTLSIPVAEIVALLSAGKIVALKGLGGFHLACDARDSDAVARLAASKRREGKPLAVMVPGLTAARRLADLSPEETALLASDARPIVVARARAGLDLAPEVAAGLGTVGVMLPSTPLHYLLFHEAAGRPSGTAWLEDPESPAVALVLVMTSANDRGDPLITRGDDPALARLADAVADHDRPILARCDDSVMQMIGGKSRFIRRARGMAPRPIRLAADLPPVLALGAAWKTAACVTTGRLAHLGQHVGDLDGSAAVTALRRAAEHLMAVTGARPVAVAHDLHPDFASTRLASEFGPPTVPVQHHHAHIGAVCAEHGMSGTVLGVALDGFGLGIDGKAWGGELVRVDGATFDRLGHLAPLPLPGGDRAAREPWRMAAAALHQLGRGAEIAARFGDQPHAPALARLLGDGAVFPETTSAGRWFDAACGLLGICTAGFEGAAPMRLQSLVTEPRVHPEAWSIRDGILDLLPLLGVVADRAPEAGANLFHGSLAAGLTDWIVGAAAEHDLGTVALSGGCLMNAVLNQDLVNRLCAAGLRVIQPEAVPPNDGGISLGQAWVAGHVLAARGD